MKKLSNWLGSPALVKTTYLSLAFSLLPFLIYFLFIKPGYIEAPGAGAQNHSSLLLWMAPLTIPFLSLIMSFKAALLNTKPVPVFVKGAALSVAQFALLMLPLVVLFF